MGVVPAESFVFNAFVPFSIRFGDQDQTALAHFAHFEILVGHKVKKRGWDVFILQWGEKLVKLVQLLNA